MTICEVCRTPIPIPERQGRPRRYCSRTCQNRAYRSRRMPAAMRELPRWVRWRYLPRNGRMTKAPLTLTGHLASVTNPATWATYEKASASLVGDGIGFVLGDGIGCVDLDNCFLEGGPLHPVAQGILDDHPQAMRVEVSVSGRGLHVWDRMVEDAGTVKVIDGQKVERYSRARFIALGETYRP